LTKRGKKGGWSANEAEDDSPFRFALNTVLGLFAMNAQPLIPPKPVWTEADFEQMSWHDCRLHGVGIVDDFDPHLHELRLDIDYILEWRCCEPAPEQTGFWISPATLVFEAQHFQVNLPGGGDWILDIKRTLNSSADSTDWLIRLNTGGSITVTARGFCQYLRRAPIFVSTPNQSLETRQRGAISFETSTYKD
jgi:hypothetical protein